MFPARYMFKLARKIQDIFAFLSNSCCIKIYVYLFLQEAQVEANYCTHFLFTFVLIHLHFSFWGKNENVSVIPIQQIIKLPLADLSENMRSCLIRIHNSIFVHVSRISGWQYLGHKKSYRRSAGVKGLSRFLNKKWVFGFLKISLSGFLEIS